VVRVLVHGVGLFEAGADVSAAVPASLTGELSRSDSRTSSGHRSALIAIGGTAKPAEGVTRISESCMSAGNVDLDLGHHVFTRR
jgi:hypothetical protein